VSGHLLGGRVVLDVQDRARLGAHQGVADDGELVVLKRLARVRPVCGARDSPSSTMTILRCMIAPFSEFLMATELPVMSFAYWARMAFSWGMIAWLLSKVIWTKMAGFFNAVSSIAARTSSSKAYIATTIDLDTLEITDCGTCRT
jgi:hypothetical protein